MGIRHRQDRINGGQRYSVVSPVVIVLLLQLLVYWNPSCSLPPSCFCYCRKAPSLLSSSFSSSSKPSELPTTATTVPIVLETRSNQNRIAALVPRQPSGNNRVHRSSNRQSVPCVGYYIPTPATTGTSSRRSSRSALFSRNRDEMDINEEEDEADEKSFRSNVDKENVFLSVLEDARYGANRVHKDFLGLSWTVYSQTFLWTAPFVCLLFVVLPACSSSSSPFLRLLATRVQGYISGSFAILAECSNMFFVRPMHALVSWWKAGSVTGPRSAWKSGVSGRGTLVWGLLWGPIVEEFIFRFAFRGFWKALFRPIAIGSNNNSEDRTSDDQPVNGNNSVSVAPLSLFAEILSTLRPIPLQNKKPKPVYINRSWRIASGVCFGIAHFSNYFPIDPGKYTFDGEIRLPTGTVRERFLLGLFPAGFASQSANKEFCLVSMVIIGAVYQAMHCFINTMILYGPLLDSKSKSKRGGIFAAIGAHIAWNTNALCLITNLKLRLLRKMVFLPLFRSIQQQNRKRQDQ